MAEQDIVGSSRLLFEILHLSSFGTSVLSIAIRLGLSKSDMEVCFDYLLRNRLIEISDSESGSMVHITGRGMQVFKKISKHF